MSCIRPTDDEPGFRKVTIAPKISYKLGRLDAVYPSSAGTYKIHWDAPCDKRSVPMYYILIKGVIKPLIDFFISFLVIIKYHLKSHPL